MGILSYKGRPRLYNKVVALYQLLLAPLGISEPKTGNPKRKNFKGSELK